MVSPLHAARGMRAPAVLLAAILAAIAGCPSYSETLRDSGLEAKERSALLRIYGHIDIPASRREWNMSLDHCRWRGVHCELALAPGSRRVTGLSLQEALWPIRDSIQQGLEVSICIPASGHLLSELCNFRELEKADLSTACLSGGALPKNFSCLPHLAQLSLTHWRHEGEAFTLPGDWVHWFPRLQLLSIVNCSLSGTLPAGWAQGFRQLQELDLNHNHLSGPLPPAWAKGFPELVTINLQANSLTGGFPRAWSSPSFPRLQSLSLSDNPLRGSLPEAWAPPAALLIMDVNHCGLAWSAATSTAILHSPNLLSFLARGNSLGGEQLPASLCGSSLEAIDLGSNGLTGTLPQCGDHFETKSASLKYLTLDNNSISGTLPAPWIRGLPLLEHLELGHNPIRGGIPWLDVTDMLFLIYLGLAGTQISNLPAEIFTNHLLLPRLTHLSLAGANISGTLPDTRDGEGARLPAALGELDLSNNRLTGTLPSSWGTLPRLSALWKLNLSSNALTGEIPGHWFAHGALWTGLQFMDLHGNDLRAAIPGPAQSQFRSTRLIVTPGNEELCLTPVVADQWKARVCDYRSWSALKLWGTEEALCPAAKVRHCARQGILSGEMVLSLIFGGLALALAGTSLLKGKRRATYARITDNSLDVELTRSVYAQDRRRASPRVAEPGVDSSTSSNGSHRRSATGQRAGVSTSVGSTQDLVRNQFLRELYREVTADRQQPSDGGPVVEGLMDEEAEGTGSLLHISLSNLAFSTRADGSLDCLGSGGQAKIYGAMLHRTFRVAVKVLPHTGGDVGLLMREAEVLFRCSHPNILQLFGICETPSLLMLVSEFMAGGTLADALQSPDYRWYKRGRATLIQIVSGLLYLHQKSICHFDIKPANIMFDVDGVAKLCDAGLARILEASAISSIRQGTLTYAAPETIMGQRTGPPGDVFALGVVMQELIVGERLARRGGSRAIRVPEDCPQSIADLVQGCMSFAPDSRPTVAAVRETLLATHEMGEGQDS